MKLIKVISAGFIVFVATIFMAVGLGALISPETLMGYLKIGALEESAYNSIRSIYGGLNLAIAIFLGYAAFNMRKTGLGLIILYMFGFLIGRIYSFIELGLQSKFVLNWTFVELILLIGSVLLLKSLVRASKNEQLLRQSTTWN